MLITTITSIPTDQGSQAKRGWTVEINGKVVPEISSVRISNPGFGDFNYGRTPEGYDSWRFHELGGGGSVIVPYAVVDERLYVGLLTQRRSTQIGCLDRWGVPRGFLNPQESYFETALREAQEEIGKTSFSLAERLVDLQEELHAEPSNPNSAFFETLSAKEGVSFFALRIVPEELEKVPGYWCGDYDYLPAFNFKKGVLEPLPDLEPKDKKQAEQILGCGFYDLSDAVRVKDGFTRQAIALLREYMDRKKETYH